MYLFLMSFIKKNVDSELDLDLRNDNCSMSLLTALFLFLPSSLEIVLSIYSNVSVKKGEFVSVSYQSQ